MTIHGKTGWNYNHYVPLPEQGKCAITITQLIPSEHGCSLTWDNDGDIGYVVSWKDTTSGEGGRLLTSERSACISGLCEGHDYHVSVSAQGDGISAAHRLIRCGHVTGAVVNYLHPADNAYRYSGRFLASPSLVELPSGKLLASMDVFEWHGGQNVTLLFESDDGGISWQYLTDLVPCFWGMLFVHRGVLYMLATATEYGDLLIGKSDDEGMTWSVPVSLFRGSGNGKVGGLHKAPMPIIEVNGSLVTAIDYGSWETGGFRHALLSISADADLLDARQWKLSEMYDPKGDLFCDEGVVGGGLEGNAVLGPDGIVYDLLRLQIDRGVPQYGRALLLSANAGMNHLEYAGVIDYNGGSNSKFFVLYDSESHNYWAVGNEIVSSDLPGARNVLSLSVSQDLRSFTVVHRVVDMSQSDASFVAAQYPSFVFSGRDMLIVSRSSANGADSYHNSNYITFHRVSNFRQYAEA